MAINRTSISLSNSSYNSPSNGTFVSSNDMACLANAFNATNATVHGKEGNGGCGYIVTNTTVNECFCAKAAGVQLSFALQGYTSATFTPDVGSTFAGVVATRLGLKPSAVAVVAVNGVFLDSPMYVRGREREHG